MALICPSCASETSESQRFCGQCGAHLAPPSEFPTAAPRSDAGPRGVAGLAPGTLVAGRYRIVSLLGRGGMGEVYRADDLELGVTVAMKFLPPALASDRGWRARFASEVSLTRRISHPHVCRVFDIGDAAPDGPPFLTMEYVDGEDLASLLRRIGRLPADKALEIGRQICAGLAAAHARGVLHRDLKPANVMIDGRGHVRIMDFGIAVSADAPATWDVAGTPAYMAPELTTGAGRPSASSDIYALGLVLYELYTGKPGYSTSALARERAGQARELPPAPSDLVRDIDPSVERVIMRALAPAPDARPAAVVQVAAALPGGSPVEATLLAGETPSPEMVAAAGASEGPAPTIVWALVALILAGAAGAIGLGSSVQLWRFAAPDRSPDVLADRARTFLAGLGHSEAVDRASAFEVDLEHLRYAQQRHPSTWRAMRPDPGYLRFWYRESPEPLEAWRFPFLYGNISRITPADPPNDLAGMRRVRLDPGGRLIELLVVPPAEAPADDSAPTPDWVALLREAGYDPSVWTRTRPQRHPPVYGNASAAWEGFWPGGNRDLPVRLEAAALNGSAVYFEAVFPWTPPPRSPAPLLTRTERASFLIAIVVLGAVIAGAIVAARRNVRAGSGDRRGAFRLSAFVFSAMVVSWFFGESHVSTLWEVVLVVMGLSLATLAAAVTWLAYLAVEPFLRRWWPEVLITWTRLLSGEVRDPIVGRDILAGCAAATCLAMVAELGLYLPAQLDVATNLVFVDAYGIVHGVQAVVPFLLWRAAQSVVAGLCGVLVLVLLRRALGSGWAAAAVFTVGATVLGVGATVLGGGTVSGSWIEHTSSAIHFGVFAALIVGLGLLPAVVQFYVWGLFIFFPMTADLGAWYAGAGVTALLVVVALIGWGLTAALARRPAFGAAGSAL